MCALAAFIVTYTPLVDTQAGRKAAESHGLPPFIDGSIRREPDLEHEFPAISCLCRAGKFAPRLNVGDVVAYMTKNHRFGTGRKQRHLAAVLVVDRILDSHSHASEWYRERGLRLPSNCWVDENPAEPLDRCHRRFPRGSSGPDDRRHRQWDNGYRIRVETHPRFLVCRALFRDLSWEAPVVADQHLLDAFGRIPGTQNPGALPEDGFTRLMQALGISFRSVG
jgi:hypothetical protein